MTGLLRRSELALPACNDHMFAKGASSGADLVFLDLEDATPVSLKVESRAKAIKALNELTEIVSRSASSTATGPRAVRRAVVPDP